MKQTTTIVEMVPGASYISLVFDGSGCEMKLHSTKEEAVQLATQIAALPQEEVPHGDH